MQKCIAGCFGLAISMSSFGSLSISSGTCLAHAQRFTCISFGMRKTYSPLKSIEYGMYGDLSIIDPNPYSLYS